MNEIEERLSDFYKKEISNIRMSKLPHRKPIEEYIEDIVTVIYLMDSIKAPYPTDYVKLLLDLVDGEIDAVKHFAKKELDNTNQGWKDTTNKIVKKISLENQPPF